MWKKSDGSTWNVNDTDLSEMDIFTLNTVYSKPLYNNFVRFPVQSEAQVVMLKEKFALYKHFRKTTEVFSVGSMAIRK